MSNFVTSVPKLIDFCETLFVEMNKIKASFKFETLLALYVKEITIRRNTLVTVYLEFCRFCFLLFSWTKELRGIILREFIALTFFHAFRVSSSA